MQVTPRVREPRLLERTEMITLKQRSGHRVILGTKGEKTIVEALQLLYERYKEDYPAEAQYVKSLLEEVQK